MTVSLPKDYRWHLGFLDSLRGIAVLGVIMVHSGMSVALPGRVAHITNSGQRGVQLFFLVSAFTLFMSNDHRQDEHHPHLNFALRRIFRLLPMFYVATAITCLVMPQYAGPRRDVILSLFLLHGFSPHTIIHGAVGGWSVATEAIFYMCLPFLFRLIQSLAAAIWLLFLSAPVMWYVSMRLTRHFPGTDYFAFFGFPVNLPVFAMGIACYFLWKKHVAGELRESAATPEHRELSALLLCLTAFFYYRDLPFSYPDLYSNSLVGAFLLIGLALYPRPLIVNRLTIFLGKVSFSVYLLHFFILFQIHDLFLRKNIFAAHPIARFALIFLATAILVIPLAAFTWQFIEVPGIKLGRRLISYLERRAAARQSGVEIAPTVDV